MDANTVKSRNTAASASWARWWSSPRAGLAIATAVAIVVAMGMGRELFEGEQHGEPGALSALGPTHPRAANHTRLAGDGGTSWLIATAASPSSLVIWKIGLGGRIERIDDGVHTQAIRSPVSTDLLAASAPTPVVCWIVGRGGVVIRTGDRGGHWQRVTSPTRTDLVSVTAYNAHTATVVSADSQRYSTSDGGRTWHSP